MAPRSNTRSRPFFRGSRGGSSFRGQRGRGRGGANAARSDTIPKQDDEGTRLAERFEQVKTCDEIDEKLGFFRVQEGPKKEGWLVNMHPVEC
jgi:DNA polymerase epsilon subunit 1